MDAKGDYVACCGYSDKGGRLQADSYMKVRCLHVCLCALT